MNSVIQAQPPVSLPVNDSDETFPVQNIYCVGRNYAEHAVEMGHDPDREEPFFFMKPAYALLPEGGDLIYPPLSHDVHHEVELVIAIGRGGTNISVADASDHIFGYGVGLDLTQIDAGKIALQFFQPLRIENLGHDCHGPAATLVKRWTQRRTRYLDCWSTLEHRSSGFHGL